MVFKSLKAEHVIIIFLILVIIYISGNNNTVKPKGEELQKSCNYTSSVQQSNCKFSNLPLFYDVYAVSSYQGSPLNGIIDIQGNRNGLNDVIVNAKNKNIILILTSYEPVVWRIKTTETTKIIGVVLGGYYNQEILGIPKSIPVLKNVYSKNTSCGYFYLSNNLDTAQAEAINKIKFITGKAPKDIQYKYNGGTFYVGKPVTNNDSLVSCDEYKLSDYLIKSYQPQNSFVNRNVTQNTAPVNYTPANAQSASPTHTESNSSNWKEDATVSLVTNNYIRRATILDIQEWENKARAPYLKSMGNSAEQMHIQHDMSPDHTYIVQKSFRIPEDFCYGHFINFIIPNGVQAPANKQNCGFYFLKDGSQM